jgi:hypothetical protein
VVQATSQQPTAPPRTTLGRATGQLAGPAATQPPAQSRRGLVFGLLGILAAGGAITAVAMAGSGSSAVSDAPPAAPDAATEIATAPPPLDAAPVVIDAAPAPPPMIEVRIRSRPTGAEVRFEGAPAVLGLTPFRERRPAVDGELLYTVTKKGYKPEEVRAPGDRAALLSITLERERRTTARPTGSSKPAGTKAGEEPKKPDPGSYR